MKRIIVCGSRSFTDRAMVEKKLSKLIVRLACFELITGGCPTGADRLAEDWADRQFPRKRVVKKRFHAEWDNLQAPGAIIKVRPGGGKYNAAAGPARNKAMADYAGRKGVCIAFRNAIGPSPGTDDMLARARKMGMKVYVYKK